MKLLKFYLSLLAGAMWLSACSGDEGTRSVGQSYEDFMQALREIQHRPFDKYYGEWIVDNPQSDDVNGTVSTMASGQGNFKFRALGYIVAGHGVPKKRGPGTVISGLINNCLWKQEQNPGECVRHLYEASCTFAIYWLVASDVAGRTGVVATMGARSLMNRLTGNQENGNLLPYKKAKRAGCQKNVIDVQDEIGVSLQNSDYGVKVSCESSCRAKGLNSEIVSVLGNMANYVFNNNLNDVQFTVTDTKGKAMMRCNIFENDDPFNLCPRKITGKGCQTNI